MIIIFFIKWGSKYSPGFPGGSVVKNLRASAEDTGPILGWKDPLEKNGYSFQYSCPENSMERGAWQATVHGVTKSQMRLSE